MIDSSKAYRDAITGTHRKIEIKAIVDISDPDMEILTPESSSVAPWSKPEELHDKNFDPPARFATFEDYRWSLDGSFDIFPDDFSVDQNVSYALNELSGYDGTFSTDQWIIQPLKNVGILQGFSVYFSKDPLDGIPVDFTAEVLQGGTVYFSETITGNDKYSVNFRKFTVYNPDGIKFTFHKWSLPYRRPRIVEIIPGIYENWSGNEISEFGLQQYGDFSCLTTPYGTCEIKMDNLDRRFEPRNKSGLFASIEDRQPIDVSIGVRLDSGEVDYKHTGVYYQYADGWKTGDNGTTIKWSLVDIVGLLSNREFIAPETLPTTLVGWIAEFASQLGVNFANKYHVDPLYSNLEIKATQENIVGQKIGDLLRYACMACGVWPRADNETGFLTVEPMWNQGNMLTLDNIPSYPSMSANTWISALIFTLDDNKQYVIGGNSTSSEQTVSIKNPFIHTEADAIKAAKIILSCYGGNVIDITGRGDPSSEIGDVDTVWLDESTATTGRRMSQSFSFSGGVMRNCASKLLQADGSYLFEERVVITQSGKWSAPAGISKIRLILVGKGKDGKPGKDGTWDSAGESGENGTGGLVWSETVNINPGQEFDVTISDDTIFGNYSSANGNRYEYGFTDVQSGDSFARTGVSKPIAGSGDGGAGGAGGSMGIKYDETSEDGSGNEIINTVIEKNPGKGKPGANGALGCAVVYWEKITDG